MTLAAQHGRAHVAELGAGCGVGAAWIATGLRDGSRLVTVEADAQRAQAAREVLAGRADVQVLTAIGASPATTGRSTWSSVMGDPRGTRGILNAWLRS